MADGEVEVSVTADGVEDAAGEMAGDAAGAGAVPGGGGGGGGKGGKGGKLLGKTLSRILGLIAFLGPILKVVGIVSDVLTAFVAPLAILLLRVLQPLLMLMLKLLPLYLTYFEKLVDVVDWLAKVRDAVITYLMNGVSKLGGWITSLPKQIWSFIKDLPKMIGAAVGNVMPDIPGFGGGGGGDGVLSGLRDRFGGGDDGGGDGGGGTQVSIGGGLMPFVDKITQNGSVDFP